MTAGSGTNADSQVGEPRVVPATVVDVKPRVVPATAVHIKPRVVRQ